MIDIARGVRKLSRLADSSDLQRVRVNEPYAPAVGREALIGLPVTAVSTCQPEGWVKLGGERWKAHCSEGAGRGDSLVVEAVEQITLIVAQPLSTPLRA